MSEWFHRQKMLSQEEQSWVDEYRFARRNGEWAYVLDKGYILRNGDGKATRAIGGITDQTERRLNESALARRNTALQMLSRCNEALIRSENESQLLSAVCNIAVHTGGFRMAWVGFNNPENPLTVFPQTHAGEENGYLAKGLALAKERKNLTEGPFSRTIASGKPEVIADLSKDARFAPWLDLAHEHGYRGVICLPFHERQKTFGALLLYTDEVRQPSTEEVGLLAELADNIAFGILNLRAREERRRTFEAVEIISTGVSASTGSAFFEKLTYSMVKALGARAGSILRYDENRPEPTPLCSVLDGKPSLECHPVLPTQDDVWVSFQNGDGYETLVGMVLLDSRGRALGQICVTFPTHLEQSEFVLATLRIFATRAVAELERQMADIVVREQASLLDKAQDAIVVHDLQGRILYWNRSAQRVYGWDAEDVRGRYVGQLLYQKEESFQKACQETLSQGEWQGEIEQFTKDGQPLIVEGRWTLVEDEEGQAKSILSINTDITQRKKLEARFLRAQRMEGIGTLAGGIAHDLNNMLTPVIMSIELLRMKSLDKDDEELLDTIQSSAQRGADLVRQVLSFARGVEGSSVELNPASLMTEFQQVLRETLPKSITFDCAAADSLWTISGDKTQIHQVLLNLCVNARDAMPDGGLLHLCLENVPPEKVTLEAKPGPYVCIQVSDTGTGVPADLRDRIFEPFFTTKELGRGTGLGLSTSLAIVKSHGGWIELSSEPGRGATFRVFLPALAQAAPSPTAPGASSPQRGNNELILVVDDEEAVRKVAQTTLERFGYRVLLASNGAEGLEAYQENGDVISAVLTDMAMPVMDGPAMIVALKSMDPGVRIIASSSFTSNSSMSKATDAGIACFIPKPYTADAMLKTLHEVLAKS